MQYEDRKETAERLKAVAGILGHTQTALFIVTSILVLAVVWFGMWTIWTNERLDRIEASLPPVDGKRAAFQVAPDQDFVVGRPAPVPVPALADRGLWSRPSQIVCQLDEELAAENPKWGEFTASSRVVCSKDKAVVAFVGVVQINPKPGRVLTREDLVTLHDVSLEGAIHETSTKLKVADHQTRFSPDGAIRSRIVLTEDGRVLSDLKEFMTENGIDLISATRPLSLETRTSD